MCPECVLKLRLKSRVKECMQPEYRSVLIEEVLDPKDDSWDTVQFCVFAIRGNNKNAFVECKLQSCHT